MQTRVGTLTGEMYRPHLTQEQIADAEQIAKNPEELAQHLLSMTPVLGQLDSANTAINGHKFVSNEAATLGERIFNGATTSLAALPFIGVVVSNASNAKPLATITNRVDNLADGAKAASKAPKGIANLSDELRICGDLARARLRSALGLVRGSADEAHHLIPVGLRDHDVVQRAARGGFNFNGVDNGVAMTFDRHRGVNIFHHNKYNEAIRSRLERELLGTPNMTDAQAADFLRSYTEQLRNAINNTRGRLR